jgi:hypothetical protein
MYDIEIRYVDEGFKIFKDGTKLICEVANPLEIEGTKYAYIGVWRVESDTDIVVKASTFEIGIEKFLEFVFNEREDGLKMKYSYSVAPKTNYHFEAEMEWKIWDFQLYYLLLQLKLDDKI